MSPHTLMHRILPGASALLLAACGGGGGGSTPTISAPPPPPVISSAPNVRISAATPFPAGCDGAAQGGTVLLNAEVEPFAAASAANPANVIAVWQQDRWSNGGARGLMTGVSFDAGQSWSRVSLPFSRCTGGSYERASDPWVSFGPTGIAYQIALAINGQVFEPGSASAILASRSLDGGNSWSPPATLKADGADAFNDKESITADATDSRYVYAVWDRLAQSGGGPTWFARSSDSGASWEPARVIYDPGVRSQTLGNQIVVLPDSRLLNLYTQIDTASNNTVSAFFAVIRSSDHGTTWSAPVRVADARAVGARDPQTGNLVRDGAGLASIAVAPGGTVYVVWQDARGSGGARDAILLARSSDGGSSFSAPLRVNADASVPAFTPAIAVAADGTLGISYYDYRSNTADANTLFTDTWLARSTDGINFSEIRLASPFDLNGAPNARGLFVGDYQGLAASGGKLLPVFARGTGEAGNRTDVFAVPNLTLPAGSKALSFTAAELPATPPRADFAQRVSERLLERIEKPGSRARRATRRAQR